MAEIKTQVLLFAAGYGKRLAPITNITPKPLVEIGSTTLIERIITQLKQAHLDNIVINVSHLKDKIIDHLGDGSQYGVNIKYSEESPTPKETAGAIIYALEQKLLQPETQLITVNADIYTNFPFAELKYKKTESAHLVMVKNPGHNLQGDFSCINNIIGDRANKYTYSGIGVFSPNFILNNYSSNKLGKIIHDSLKSHSITGEVFNGTWHDIGSIDRLHQLRKNLKQKSIES
ncbi:MAG: NTP transferase domain-containing protein [Legionellales bacterium]|jgi:N-acetyl-alpha-D-muramate 1-phosphate uridylyltransferase|nr:NTP transferase domain-containing protein [Legionellales bacterium]